MLHGWYTGRSLLEEMERVPPAARQSTVGARLCISEVRLGGGGGSGLSVSGTVLAGMIDVGDRLLLMPARELVTVRGLRSRGVTVPRVVAGDQCDATLLPSTPVEPTAVGPGSVLCDPSRPMPISSRLEMCVRMVGLAGCEAPLTLGQPLELHVHVASCACRIHRFVCWADAKSGSRIETESPPRTLGVGCGRAAYVHIELEKPLPVELHADCRHLGRVALRDGGKTIATGVITGYMRPHTTAR